MNLVDLIIEKFDGVLVDDYGKDSQFIDVTSVMSIAKTMNKKFLEKNWFNGLSITCYINILLNVYVDIKWNQPRQEKNLVGNVYGKSVVMKPIKHLMVLYIGRNPNE